MNLSHQLYINSKIEEEKMKEILDFFARNSVNSIISLSERYAHFGDHCKFTGYLYFVVVHSCNIILRLKRKPKVECLLY